MKTFEFTLVLEGEDVLSEPILDALFEAGCDDATFGEVDGVPFADFSREAGSLAEAVETAIQDVRSVPGVFVLRVEPDELVTAAEIAVRLGRSRESVRLLVSGERGPGSFPAPVSHLKLRGRLWLWSDVATWARDSLGLDVSEEDSTAFIAALNDALELARLVPALSGPSERRAVFGALRPLRRGRAGKPTAPPFEPDPDLIAFAEHWADWAEPAEKRRAPPGEPR
jgi:hypothetical protein